jgi:hypothetical protein
MSHLAKLNVKTVDRNAHKDPAVKRREKLCAAIEEQLRVQAAAEKGEQYAVASKRWQKNAAGERVLVEHQKRVRAWFFEQDGGWYVQCKYGSRVVQLGDKGNAVFAKDLAAVKAALEAFYAACAAGELDAALSELAVRKRT